MRLLLLGLLFLASGLVYSKSEDCSLFYPVGTQLKSCDYKILAHYRQTSYATEDHLGDYVLLKGFGLRLKEKVNLLFGQKNIQNELSLALFDEENKLKALELLGLSPLPAPDFVERPADFDPENFKYQVGKSDLSEELKKRILNEPDKYYFESKKNPLKIGGLVDMFAQVINEEKTNPREGCESTIPVVGEEQRWAKGQSPISGSPLRSKYKIFSKLLIALAMGETNAFMYIGQEANLREWLLNQKERSVNFENIFRKSYQLNCGNISNSMMTILNILSEHFRVPDRQKLLQTTKLSPIINHLGNREDTFGPWYHFFGLMIYGYHRGVFTGAIMANIEKGTSIFYNEMDERQENYMIGALKVGRTLRKMIEKNKLDSKEMNSEFLRRDHYLDLTEDYSKKINKAFK